jgi:hypothetical protein
MFSNDQVVMERMEDQMINMSSRKVHCYGKKIRDLYKSLKIKSFNRNEDRTKYGNWVDFHFSLLHIYILASPRCYQALTRFYEY